jgi:outer membrane protein assembly factor BamB
MMSTGWTAVLLVALHAGGQDEDDRRPEFDIDYDAHRVVCQDAAGKVGWATRLDGYLGQVRPPHLVWDKERVYVSHGDGVAALDAKSGKVVWHTRGPLDRLFLSGDLLLATDCQIARTLTDEGRRVVALATASGKVIFTAGLPPDLDPEPISEVAGLFLVQELDGQDGHGYALLLDRQGRVCHRLDRQVVAGLRRGPDLILLTSRDVVRLSPEGRTRWVASLDREWTPGGGLVELPGGDVVAFLFDYIKDSGVQLARLDPVSGKVVWEAFCDQLGVTHSEYDHEAIVTVEGGRLRVTSWASGGTFTELRDLRSGRRLRRTQHLDENFEEP